MEPLIYHERYELVSYKEIDLEGDKHDRIELGVYDNVAGSSHTIYNCKEETCEFAALYDEIIKDMQSRFVPDLLDNLKVNWLQCGRRKALWKYQVCAFTSDDSLQIVMTSIDLGHDDPFLPEILNMSGIDGGDHTLKIQLNTPKIQAWMLSLVQFLQIDRMWHEILEKTKGNIDLNAEPFFMYVDYFITKALKKDDNTLYLKLVALALEGVFEGAYFIDNGFELIYHSVDEDVGSPIPNFKHVPIPPSCPQELSEHIDVDQNGFVDNIGEAWRVHSIAKTNNDVSLQKVNDNLTQVDVENGIIDIFGYRFKPLKNETGDLDYCMDEKRLFAIGEAMRSFGYPMVHRWALGVGSEGPLKLIFTTPHQFSEHPFGLDVLEMLEQVFDPRNKSTKASYTNRSNLFVSGCQKDFNSQYGIARHELGHAVDDWLSPDDDNRPFAWQYNENLFSRLNDNVILQGFQHFFKEAASERVGDVFRNFREKEAKNGRVTTFTDYHLDSSEWFAELFRRSGNWVSATPEVKHTVKCFLDGSSAKECTGKVAPVFISPPAGVPII